VLTISPRDKAIEHYRHELDEYRKQGVEYESATRTAFQNLLARFAPSAGWIVIPEQPLSNGRRPDATLRDGFTLPRGGRHLLSSPRRGGLPLGTPRRGWLPLGATNGGLRALDTHR